LVHWTGRETAKVPAIGITDKGSWSNYVVVQAKIKIKLSDGIAMANNKENILIIELCQQELDLSLLLQFCVWNRLLQGRSDVE